MKKRLLIYLLVVAIVLCSLSFNSIVLADDFPLDVIIKYSDKYETGKDISNKTSAVKIIGAPNGASYAILGITVSGSEYDMNNTSLNLHCGNYSNKWDTLPANWFIALPFTKEYFNSGMNTLKIKLKHISGAVLEKELNFDVDFTGQESPENNNSAPDFIVSDWARGEVEEAYNEGLIPETLIGTDLTQKINRSEFAAIAVLVYEKISGKSVSAASTPFVDIAYDVNKDAIEKAYKLGITNGTGATNFSPSRNITREELATMLCRGIKKYKFSAWTLDTDYMYYIQGTSGIKFADDAEISDYARDSVYFMANAGIIRGVDSTHFAPKASVTRGDAINYGMATREQAIIMAKRIKENKNYFDEI